MLLIDILKMSLTRILTLYVVYLGIIILFLIFGIRIARRGAKTRQVTFITRFFILTALSLVVNIVYAPFADETIQFVGNRLVIAAVSIGIVYLMFFAISLHRSTVEFKVKTQHIIEIVMLAMVIVYFFLKGDFDEQYAPIWFLPMVIYTLIVTQSLYLCAIWFGVQTVREIDDKVIKKRLLMFIFGIILVEIVLLSTILANGLIVPRLVTTITGVAIIPGGVLIYYSVGRNLARKS